MKALPAICLLMVIVGLLVAPASAAQYQKTNTLLLNFETTKFNGVYSTSLDASQNGKAIALVQVFVPSGSQVDFTLYYGCSSTVTGYIRNDLITILPPRTQAEVSIGGDTKTYSYVDVQPVIDMDIVGYAKDTNVTPEQTGFMVYSVDYGFFDNDLAAFYAVNNIGVNTIYKIEATGTKPFDIYVSTASKADVAGGASKSALDVINEWIALALQIAQYIYNLIGSMLYWIKFFFIDNLTMTVSGYLALTLVFAARAARGNIAKLYRTWINDQKALFMFIIELWRVLVEIVATFRGIFRI